MLYKEKQEKVTNKIVNPVYLNIYVINKDPQTSL
jgi:hypothetical protein